jgi:hypothetical protein
MNIHYDEGPIFGESGAEITMTGVQPIDCNSPSYTQSFCAYYFTGATGTLYGDEYEPADETYAPCSASAQEAVAEDGFVGYVELGGPPDGNGGIEIGLGVGPRDDVGCFAGIGVGSLGGPSALSLPWVPGSQTSSWPVYRNVYGEGVVVVGTITMNWQY